MKINYKSPEFEIIKITLSADVLNVSQPEVVVQPTGVVHDPDDDLIEELP